MTGETRTNAGETAASDAVETRTTTVEASAPKATMREFGHGNPYTGETFGSELAFERGPAVAADGGEPDAGDDESDTEDAADDRTMEDVDHEHPHEDAADANRVFARGKDADENGTV